jgi:CRP-like cAMP-binding protein
MLSIGKLKIVEAGHLLFTEGEPITHLTLIVLGKVVLTKAYNPLKKYALTGESLGEECLFDESKPYAVRIVNNPSPIFYKLQARAYSQVCLLRVKLAKYYKTCL